MLSPVTMALRLKKGEDRRVRQGHPWVFSNEVLELPKALKPGQMTELQDASGRFVAWGYVNPQSLICFRVLSRNPDESDPAAIVSARIHRALRLRQILGAQPWSFRVCFGEADGLPGLVIDRYRTESGQVVIVQSQTAGADGLADAALKALSEEARSGVLKLNGGGGKTHLILRRDAGSRTREGLEKLEPVAFEGDLVEAGRSAILLKPARGGGEGSLKFDVDLVGGQKTGFFLDQAANIERMAQSAVEFARARANPKAEMKILDLCSYVGQWGAQLSDALKRDAGVTAHVTAVDASERALELARINVERAGGKFTGLKMDVVEHLKDARDLGMFDIVICDPPALIQSRKHIPVGKAAYVSLFAEAVRRVSSEGLVALCSCSGLLGEEDFSESVARATYKAQKQVSWIYRGGAAPDHPVAAEFPEGKYLKGWIGYVCSK